MIKILKLKIKGVLGYCQSKGCKNKSVYQMDIPKTKTRRYLCEICAGKIVENGTVKSVKYEETIHFGLQEEDYANMEND